MRTDCTIDGRAVVCPNASLIGYGARTARVGSFLTYAAPSDTNPQYARMLGRIAFAPALASNTACVKNWILAAVLSRYGSSIHERWINPMWVNTVEPVPTATAAFFFAPKLQYDCATYRHLVEHGTLQEPYVSRHAERVAEWKARKV